MCFGHFQSIGSLPLGSFLWHAGSMLQDGREFEDKKTIHRFRAKGQSSRGLEDLMFRERNHLPEINEVTIAQSKKCQALAIESKNSSAMLQRHVPGRKLSEYLDVWPVGSKRKVLGTAGFGNMFPFTNRFFWGTRYF